MPELNGPPRAAGVIRNDAATSGDREGTIAIVAERLDSGRNGAIEAHRP